MLGSVANMNRREILKGLAITPFLIGSIEGNSNRNSFRRKKIKKPKRLSKGDTVGIIAPASGASEEEFERALNNFEEMGFKTKVGKYARGINGFLSGTDQQRLHDLHWAFSNSEIDAVWCIRGGYGVSRILPKVNYKLIKRNPKILVGYSDITALHLAIYRKTKLVTFHGPVGTSTYTDYAKTHVLSTLMTPTSPYKVELPKVPEGEDPELYKALVVRAGKSRGRLIGGNLSLLTALAGTPYGLKNTKGKILFIEDVGEKPYRVDRMLTQLRQSINMRELAGIALGVFTGGKLDADEVSQSLEDVIKDRLGDLGIPVIYGLAFGHIRNQFTIPVGIKAELDTQESTLTFLENGVV